MPAGVGRDQIPEHFRGPFRVMKDHAQRASVVFHRQPRTPVTDNLQDLLVRGVQRQSHDVGHGYRPE